MHVVEHAVERSVVDPARAVTHLVRAVLCFVVLVSAVLRCADVHAQRTGQTPEELQRVGLDEKLGESVPADVIFRDETGRDVRLGRFFDGKRPVLLNFVYHDCPMLCNLVVDGLIRAMARMTWIPGREFEVLTISFSAAEGPAAAAEAKRRALHRLGKSDAAEGWHFLTGTRDAIAVLTDAVGFRYEWVEDQQDFAHPTVLTFLSGEGKVSRYLYGVEYDPGDVRSALVEASEGHVGSTLDQVILYCFQYDSAKNSYVPHAMNLMKLGGLLTMIVLFSILAAYWRIESIRSRRAASA